MAISISDAQRLAEMARQETARLAQQPTSALNPLSSPGSQPPPSRPTSVIPAPNPSQGMLDTIQAGGGRTDPSGSAGGGVPSGAITGVGGTGGSPPPSPVTNLTIAPTPAPQPTIAPQSGITAGQAEAQGRTDPPGSAGGGIDPSTLQPTDIGEATYTPPGPPLGGGGIDPSTVQPTDVDSTLPPERRKAVEDFRRSQAGGSTFSPEIQAILDNPMQGVNVPAGFDFGSLNPRQQAEQRVGALKRAIGENPNAEMARALFQTMDQAGITGGSSSGPTGLMRLAQQDPAFREEYLRRFPKAEAQLNAIGQQPFTPGQGFNLDADPLPPPSRSPAGGPLPPGTGDALGFPGSQPGPSPQGGITVGQAEARGRTDGPGSAGGGVPPGAFLGGGGGPGPGGGPIGVGSSVAGPGPITTTPIDPAGSQRSVNIDPTPAGDFRPAAGLIDRAVSEAGNIQTPTLSPEAQRARQAASRASGNLDQLPDRVQLALNAYNRFQEESQPRHEAALRGVGQRAAALGRVGAGMTTTELSDLELTRQRDLDRRRNELIDTATGQSVGDRIARLNAQLGAGSQLGGQDLDLSSASAISALQRAGLFGSGASGLADLEGQRFGQEFARRGEARGERGRQDTLAQRAIDNRMRQAFGEDALMNSEFQRRLSLEQLAANLVGGGGANTILTASQLGQPGTSTSDILAEWARTREG